MRYSLPKASIQLFQPILHQTDDGKIAGTELVHDPYVLRHLFEDSETEGCLVRQTRKKASWIQSRCDGIEFDDITVSEGRPTFELVAKTYELQNHSMPCPRMRIESTDNERIQQFRECVRQAEQCNILAAASLRRQSGRRP